MVTVVRQTTPWNCVLACIESILRDRGVELTQADLIERFPHECCKGRKDSAGNDITGAVDVRHLPEMLVRLGLGPNVRTGRAPEMLLETIGTLERGGAILLVANKNLAGAAEHHCVRVVGASPNARVAVMNPSHPIGSEVWPWEHLAARDCDVIAVSP